MVSIAGLAVMDANSIQPDYLRALIMGKPGSGKTTAASTIALAGKTLFVDLPSEQGTRSFQGAPWAKNIDVVRPTSITQLDDIYDALSAGGHGYKAVVLDSLSAVQTMAIRAAQGRSESRMSEFTDQPDSVRIQQYGAVKSFLEDLTIFWNSLASANRKEPLHVVMIAQPKAAEDEVLDMTVIRPDVQPGAIPKILSTPDYIMYTAVEENEDTEKMEHVLHFGSNPGKSMKARLPQDKYGVIPYRLVGKNANLTLIGRKLGIGGFPTLKKEN